MALSYGNELAMQQHRRLLHRLRIRDESYMNNLAHCPSVKPIPPNPTRALMCVFSYEHVFSVAQVFLLTRLSGT